MKEVDLLKDLGFDAYTVYEFDWLYIQYLKYANRSGGNPGLKSKGKKYMNALATFDIETTTLDNGHSIMYIWQFCIDGKIIIGRSWKEFLYLVKQVKRYRRKDDLYLVCYIHNAAFEFEFLTGIYKFNKEDVFAIDSRKPAKFYMKGCIEFRCSYIHSNMSLGEYTHKMHAEHGKLNGADFDYSKKRYPDTELTKDELLYCVDDVLGLYEALKIEMEHEHDDIYSIPMTSTGYVRREIKDVIRKHCNWLRNVKIQSLELYWLLRDAFRGGNTHASRFYAGRELKGIHNIDIASAYPGAMWEKYPLKEFKKIPDELLNLNHIIDLMEKRDKALLIEFEVYDLELMENVPVPYLSLSKCTEIDFVSVETDNGRVLSCKHIKTVMTDIDFKIFISQYNGNIKLSKAYYSTYQYLPKEITNLVLKYFKDKTKYKNATGAEAVYYIKQKNKLNAIYGMFAQSPLIISNYFDGENWTIGYDKEFQEMLDDYNKKMYFPYSIGVWVTAYCRQKLQRAIDFVGPEKFVYCDTDSVKYIGKEIDLDKLNKPYFEKAKKEKMYCDHEGKRYYIGIFEKEKDYSRFKTLGAKKYIYQYADSEKIYCTIAGVRKNSVYTSGGEISKYGGGDELTKNGGFSKFKEGFVFKLAGGNDVFYNDVKPFEYEEAGRKFIITNNVTIKDGEYHLSTKEDYFNLINSDEIETVFRGFFNYLEEYNK